MAARPERIQGIIVGHTEGHWESSDRPWPYWVRGPGLEARYTYRGQTYTTAYVLWPAPLRRWTFGQWVWLRQPRLAPGRPVLIQVQPEHPGEGWIEV